VQHGGGCPKVSYYLAPLPQSFLPQRCRLIENYCFEVTFFDCIFTLTFNIFWLNNRCIIYRISSTLDCPCYIVITINQNPKLIFSCCWWMPQIGGCPCAVAHTLTIPKSRPGCRYEYTSLSMHPISPSPSLFTKLSNICSCFNFLRSFGSFL